jgi:ubiquinone/menaquinone biosynthesis C-methylase UbiE
MVYLYKLSALYASLLKLLGYERGISKFIDQLELDCPKHLRILDVGCGSGIVGLQFLERFPGATLLATDLEPNFLKATLANARSRGIDESRIAVGVSDVSEPDKVTFLDNRSVVLVEKSFDIVTVGGVMGYAKDQRKTIQTLLRLIKPGGFLIDLEMS